jgi:hypothetical protein
VGFSVRPRGRALSLVVQRAGCRTFPSFPCDCRPPVCRPLDQAAHRLGDVVVRGASRVGWRAPAEAVALGSDELDAGELEHGVELASPSPSSQNRTLLEVEPKALIRLVIEAVLAKLKGQPLLRRRVYRVAEVPISWREHADSLVSCLVDRCGPR